MKMIEYLSDEDLDYLTEMITIAAGKVAVALRQLLPCSTGIKITQMHIISSEDILRLFPLGENVSCTVIRLLGDVKGELLYLLSSPERNKLVSLVREFSSWPMANDAEMDQSIVVEFANVMAGVYLAAIHDFCNLNIYPTIPAYTDKFDSKTISEKTFEEISNTILIVAKNEYIYEDGTIIFHSFMVPSVDSVHVLKDSINNAKEILGIKDH